MASMTKRAQYEWERAEAAEAEAKALHDEIATLRADLERARKWNADMVAKAAEGGTLDGYREMGARLAKAEERAEKAEAERDEALETLREIATSLSWGRDRMQAQARAHLDRADPPAPDRLHRDRRP